MAYLSDKETLSFIEGKRKGRTLKRIFQKLLFGGIYNDPKTAEWTGVLQEHREVLESRGFRPLYRFEAAAGLGEETYFVTENGAVTARHDPNGGRTVLESYLSDATLLQSLPPISLDMSSYGKIQQVTQGDSFEADVEAYFNLVEEQVAQNDVLFQGTLETFQAVRWYHDIYRR